MSRAERQRRKCSATSKRTKLPCQDWAMIGAEVCWHHGGAAAQVWARAAVRVIESQAQLAGPGWEPRDAHEVLVSAMNDADAVRWRGFAAR
jgi:hypothetical protein